jgi:chorismate mutase
MEKISVLRKKIDEIDETIIRFLKERTEVCKQIGVIKRKHRIPLRNSQRENEVYHNVSTKASKSGLNPRAVEAIYRQIVNMSLHIQETARTHKYGET